MKCVKTRHLIHAPNWSDKQGSSYGHFNRFLPHKIEISRKNKHKLCAKVAWVEQRQAYALDFNDCADSFHNFDFLKLILKHTRTYRAIQDNNDIYWTIQDHTRPRCSHWTLWTMPDHTGKYRAQWDQTKIIGAIGIHIFSHKVKIVYRVIKCLQGNKGPYKVIKDWTELYKIIQDKKGPYVTVCNPTGP